MKRHWKKIVAALIALLVLVPVGVVAASYVWVHFIESQPDAPLTQNDVIDKLNATTTVAPEPSTVDTTAAAPTTTAAAGVDGVWTIGGDSEVGYRVKESINGVDTTANGRTKAITGTFTIEGTKVPKGDFTVDMTTFKSDQSRRDGQFNGRIMAVDQFPTATFVITSPIDFGSIPAEGGTVTATATGDLTLHGTTKSVTFEVTATFANGRVGVLGNIPVTFADYGIKNPSVATIRTEDNGLLEFVLIFDKS